MKYRYLLILLLATSLLNAQNCFWLKNAGGASFDNAHCITTDPAGNVYVAGDFVSNITIGSTVLTETGSGGFFLAKYSPSGTVLSAKKMNVSISVMITDNTGNLYISGAYNGTQVFGSDTLSSLGYSDLYLAKCDPSGSFLWARSAGGVTNGEYPGSMILDNTGNIYLTGEFYSDTIHFDSVSIANEGNSDSDFFIVKYNSVGNVMWANGTGGNRYDTGRGLTTDNSGNVYVSGSFSSDSLLFGSTMLYSLASGSTSMFLVSYDPSGNVMWAKSYASMWGNSTAYEITSDGNNLYTLGEYSGVSLSVGTDSLINTSSGSTDLFFAKFDLSGNPLWAKSAGGGNYDYMKNIAMDISGNIYLMGYFTSTALAVSTDTVISNPTSSGSGIETFIVEYTSGGSFVKALKIGNSTGAHGEDIITGAGGDVYFTGEYTVSLALGSSVINPIAQNDIFVADLFSFSSGISSSTNVTCYSGTNGTATAFAAGGHTPVSYAWSTSPVQTSATATNLSGGMYNVTITEGYGCAQTSSVTISEPAPDSAVICMVTVDSISRNNIIIWDKTGFTSVDSFVVYREIATNNYQPIGTVAFDSLSEFVDTTRSLYFPNTGDPNAGTYRYKLQTKSSCGFSGPLSPYHNTIYITNAAGTFSWAQLYVIENGSNPVSSYVLMRDDSSNGNWHAVASVSGTQQTVSDPLYMTYKNTASWRVETVWGITCAPSRDFSRSISNTYKVNLVTVPEQSMENLIAVYPNPSDGDINLEFNSAKDQKITMEIFNLFGVKIISKEYLNVEKAKIDLTAFSKGVYTITFRSDTKQFTKKLVIH